MKIYLPWLGEFGSEILKYCSIIYADKSEKIVFYEEGKEALYPKFTKRRTVPKIKEKDRHCAGSSIQDIFWNDIRFEYGENFEYIKPTTTPSLKKMEFFHPIPLRRYNIKADIVIFPRWRHTMKQMNWPYWKKLVSLLKLSGYSVFAAGAKDMSFDLDCPCAWDYDRDLDASICGIENSKIRLGLVTALDILSLMCGKRPWVIISSDGMKSVIRKAKPAWRYFRQADHKKVGWKILPYWDEPYRILMEVNKWANTQF